MRVIADLHLHSKYSRAVSSQMTLSFMAQWATKKGIDVLGTGDWTHPMWFRELQANLQEVDEGVYALSSAKSPLFLLTTEISCIYRQKDKTRKIHTLVFAPNLNIVAKINRELVKRGFNIFSDGRPILGTTAENLVEIILSISDDCLIIPAHIWTPHFSLFGSISGFDSIEECFGRYAPNIYAVETGLSSDPAMNWKIGELEKRSIVSFSDAHSGPKLGREATVFELSKINYPEITHAIIKQNINYTIEFYPEEGKYHFSGHRNCGVIYSPNDVKKKGSICPVCGRPLVVGVTSRVENLADREIEIETETDSHKVRWIKEKGSSRPSYVMLVPLQEIIAEVMGMGVDSQKVVNSYQFLIDNFGNEFAVLLTADLEEIHRLASARIADGLRKVRMGEIHIEPGYDGMFGKVSIWPESVKETIDQQVLF